MKLIAELCQNHNGDYEILKDMVYAAKENGATHVKTQHIFSNMLSFRSRFEKGSFDKKGNIEVIKRPYDLEYSRLKTLEISIDDQARFVELCKKVGSDSAEVQGAGGNISYKIDGDTMLIKASGVHLIDVTKTTGYAFVRHKEDDFKLMVSETESDYNDTIKKNTLSQSYGRASMETGFHVCLKKAVIHTNGPVLIVAGAGSGKTKVLTARIAHIIKEKKAFPSQILSVTFTNKAAKEMQSRVSKILKTDATGLSWLGTFHSICAKLLRKHAKAAGLNSNFTILDTDDQVRLVKNICKSENIDTKKIAPKAVLTVIDRWKNKGYYPDNVKINKKDIYEKIILPIYKIYQQKLLDLNACDFGDLILHCVNILEKNLDIGEIYSNNFKYILVDEYQDTNFIQSKWLNLLAKKHKNICCVGDDDQSIYSWRGAEIKNFLDFDKIYKNTKIFRLEENYRSSQNILSVASNLIANNQKRVGKTLKTNLNDGEMVKLNCFKNGKDEAIGLSDEIEKKLKNKYSLNNITILVRAIFQTREFEERFLKIGLPYRIVGGTKFYDRAEIKDCIAYLRLIHQNKDDLAFERVVNNPKRSIGESSIKQIHEFLDSRTEVGKVISIYSLGAKITLILRLYLK